MKQNKKTEHADNAECKTSCADCASCYAVHIEDVLHVRAAGKNETTQLYGAEALSYYFYFLPAGKTALIQA